MTDEEKNGFWAGVLVTLTLGYGALVVYRIWKKG